MMDSCQKVVERLRILANFSFLAEIFFFFLVCCVVSQNAGFSTLVEYTSHLTESARDSFFFLLASHKRV